MKNTEVLREALEKIIEMNRQNALDQYGDAEKAESWGCVTVAREALAPARTDTDSEALREAAMALVETAETTDFHNDLDEFFDAVGVLKSVLDGGHEMTNTEARDD